MTRINLDKSFFSKREADVVVDGDLRASLFRYQSGVEAVRLSNGRGDIVLLPYQGQQIWSACFRGRPLTMVSLFDEPRATASYLENCGAFFTHCGLTAMGAPGRLDDHPLHGELPNAPFGDVALEVSQDGHGDFVALRGIYRHVVAFQTRYRAEATARLYRSSSVLSVTLHVVNERQAPMELMYLGHVNFRPVDGAELHYSARYGPASVRVRRTVPTHVQAGEGYAQILDRLAQDPTEHHIMRPGQRYDPEVVFAIDALPDAGGWCHALQVHPDGSADYVGHLHEQAPFVTRWLSRTGDQDGLGLAFPSTAGVMGRSAEAALGRLVPVAPGGDWRIDMLMGHLDPDEVAPIRSRLDSASGRA